MQVFAGTLSRLQGVADSADLVSRSLHAEDHQGPI